MLATAIWSYMNHVLSGSASKRGPIVSFNSLVNGVSTATNFSYQCFVNADFLETFVGLATTPLEQAERLEQLRILEHGYGIAVARAEAKL